MSKSEEKEILEATQILDHHGLHKAATILWKALPEPDGAKDEPIWIKWYRKNTGCGLTAAIEECNKKFKRE
jgi:hypothetical protein